MHLKFRFNLFKTYDYKADITRLFYSIFKWLFKDAFIENQICMLCMHQHEQIYKLF